MVIKSETAKFEQVADVLLDHLIVSGQHVLHVGGRFVIYDGTRYRPVEDEDVMVRRAMREMGIAQSNTLVANVIPILKERTHTPFTPPGWRDAEGMPDASDIIPFENGLLDMRGGELLPHTPEFVCLNCLEFEYDPGATCPRWEQFLGEVYEGDEARVALLAEWAGYLMTADTSAQKLLLMVGKSRSGKGTICRVLEGLVGVTNSTALDVGSLTSTFGLAEVVGKLAAFIPEVELGGRGDKAAIVEKLKAITGEDGVKIQRKYRDAVNVRVGARLTLAANTMPTLFDPSGALAGRTLILEHAVSFAGREDVHLAERLQAELPGIAQWALRGLRRLRSNGVRFTKPGVGQLRALELQSAPVRVFARECLVVERGFEAGEQGVVVTDDECEVDKEHLYMVYTSWAVENDLDVREKNYLLRDLLTLFPKLSTRRPRSATGSRYHTVRGVRLQ